MGQDHRGARLCSGPDSQVLLDCRCFCTKSSACRCTRSQLTSSAKLVLRAASRGTATPVCLGWRGFLEAGPSELTRATGRADHDELSPYPGRQAAFVSPPLVASPSLLGSKVDRFLLRHIAGSRPPERFLCNLIKCPQLLPSDREVFPPALARNRWTSVLPPTVTLSSPHPGTRFHGSLAFPEANCLKRPTVPGNRQSQRGTSLAQGHSASYLALTDTVGTRQFPGL